MTDRANHRPVSLTFISCKMLEYILYRQIIKHLEKLILRPKFSITYIYTTYKTMPNQIRDILPDVSFHKTPIDTDISQQDWRNLERWVKDWQMSSFPKNDCSENWETMTCSSFELISKSMKCSYKSSTTSLTSYNWPCYRCNQAHLLEALIDSNKLFGIHHQEFVTNSLRWLRATPFVQWRFEHVGHPTTRIRST